MVQAMVQAVSVTGCATLWFCMLFASFVYFMYLNWS